jgi:hypothetical protein
VTGRGFINLTPAGHAGVATGIGHRNLLNMVTRILTACCFVLSATAAQADLINTDFTTNFNGWTSETTLVGAGGWSRVVVGALPGPHAELTMLASNSIIRMYQDFTLPSLDPTLVNSASLSWSQALEAIGPNDWSNVAPLQQFRVLLSDSSANTLVAFATDPADPAIIGPQTRSADSGQLLAFLSQLGVNETLRLSFESQSSGSMSAAIDAINLNFTMAAVPEPGSIALACVAVGAFWIPARQRRRARQQSMRSSKQITVA